MSARYQRDDRSRLGGMAAIRQALAEMFVSGLDAGRTDTASNGNVTNPHDTTARSEGRLEEAYSQNSLSVTLRGLDTANCGPIRFYLYANELNAVTDRQGGVCGGSYDVSRMPMRKPVRLVDREGARMQVVATRLVDGVHCQVDSGGPDNLPTALPFR